MPGFSCCIILFLVACTPPAPDAEPVEGRPPYEKLGTLADPEIDEASGLAISRNEPGLLWLINDDGGPVLHAAGLDGAARGRVRIANARNSDWEDLASFVLDGVAYLMVADTGDNDGDKDLVTLYVVEEPDPSVEEVELAWRIDFRYPEGPRDAESIAVDVANARVLILSKRDIPAKLYEVPLRPEQSGPVVATFLSGVATLPQPSRRDVELAPKTDVWYWQPTAMDLSEDGRTLTILTYGGIYEFSRGDDEDWPAALARQPGVVSTIRDREAESIAIERGEKTVLITREQRHAPLVRFAIPGSDALPSTVTIMTFNVQNLFDNKDDPDKDDKAYLPLDAKQSAAHIDACNEIPVASWRDECLNLDWSDEAVDRKLTVLAETIKQVNGGRGPDIIALQEVENAAILDRLSFGYLQEADYGPAILIEGDDARGVDVAFLSRLPMTERPVLHPLVIDEFPDRAADTRGVLQATFLLPDGSSLTGFSVHFPAPFHPIAMREHAYDHLNSLRNALPPERNVFAAGDFNTTSTEMREQKMLERFVKPYWTVAHEHCDGCPGSYYYARDDTWSFLDIILFSPARGEKATWRIRADSVRIANQNPAQVTADGRPNRHDAAAGTGVSDHWPLTAIIETTQKQ